MATYTATSFLVNPRLVHAGVNAQTFRYTLSAAASLTDCILLAKVPWGATVVELLESHTTGSTAFALDVGYDSSPSAFISAGAQATANRLIHAGVGTQFSGSDDAQPRYSILKATVASGTMTTSLKIAGMIQYTFGD